MLRSSRAALLVAVLTLAGCAELPPDYLRAGPWTPADRELQGRRFEGIAEPELLAAAVAVLQDLGFTLETSHTGLGFVQGTMLREAKAPEQVLMLVMLAALATSAGAVPTLPPAQGSSSQRLPEEQTIGVLLTVRPARPGDARAHVVLVTFHRQVRQPLWQSAGPLREPLLYQSFFELLSRAVFLEAHKL
jgi:hypothetical protein